jgi:hypothetical protein
MNGLYSTGHENGCRENGDLYKLVTVTKAPVKHLLIGLLVKCYIN